MSVTIAPQHFDVPDAIGESRLFRSGGASVVGGLVARKRITALRQEACECYSTAARQESSVPDHNDTRGGTPPRRLLTAGAGPVQDELYTDPRVATSISEVCGLTVRPSGSRGSYSYYARQGDFLGIHRDIETCDVAVITVLEDSAPRTSGGALVMWASRSTERLSAVRANPRLGAALVKVPLGATLVMLGGVVPHCVLPVRSGQLRLISVLCFEATP